ncbi:FAD-dependent oxidoreductase [Rhizobium sp. Root274]|uniref:NAD(P)/FAD-dependent oxidoreductase n=1 Tax=unclassified Rhizobium TaxID=2613769 RepID=UPI0007128DFF|nr:MULTISPECIES: FAD-binding oxidoreductase [unclassified Rhizobium]KQW29227.1 FAD-dependent oxidoreductase [Rhizobium sp. Root1240]KRD29423.1 FAD-dependent oxidoreductase [Rhizobium sp. Root274]
MIPSLPGLPVWRRPASMPTFGFIEGQVDLLVIGAGYQGLSAAYHAARQGLKVQVIEARGLGDGASGVNGGQVIPGLKHDPETLRQLLGEEAGQRLVDFSAGTADAVFDLIHSEGLDVEHQRNGWILAAHTQTAVQAAVQRNRQWRKRGADVMMLNAAEVAFLTGARGYCGGWLDRRAGMVNPLALVFALAHLATLSGAGLLLNEAVTSLHQRGSLWAASTDRGRTLLARKVLVATNAFSGTLVNGLAESLVWLHSFQIATAPLPSSLLDQVLPGGQPVSDSRRILVYYRRSPDGRLVVGGRGPMREPRSAEDWAHLERAMLRLFPALRDVPVTHRWFGRVAMTPDYLPHVHEPAPGLFMVAGCQGRGIGLMTALGPSLAAYAASGDARVLPLPVTPLRPIPFHRFRCIGVAAHVAWYRLLDSLER